ncbi:hypothetical protein WMY93_015414 [Mugilogobius chulae]|uniref:Histone deacetylase domain-containing protein n=1 Tax=Mugilogobius chulae TaxID=88201 RepID=A0AAW0NSQ4_9GOBI
MTYRATPNSSTGASPAELLMGRKIRTTLPTLQDNLTPGWPDMDTIKQADATAKQKQAYFYNRRNGVRSLPPLNPGDTVLTKLEGQKLWAMPAVVQSASSTPRSYVVETAQGERYRRNRRHLLVTPSRATPEKVCPVDHPQTEDSNNNKEFPASVTLKTSGSIVTRSGRLTLPPQTLTSAVKLEYGGELGRREAHQQKQERPECRREEDPERTHHEPTPKAGQSASVATAGFRAPVSDALSPHTTSDPRKVLRRTVSEPTLKCKLKKMIGARPNPLRRKISAPPAVRFRSDTGSDSPCSSSSRSVSESSSCDSLLSDSVLSLTNETPGLLVSPKHSTKPNITMGLPAQAGPPSLAHFSPLYVPLDVGTALSQRLQPVLVLDQSTGILHHQFVALPDLSSVPVAPQRPLPAVRGSHRPLKRTRSEPTPCTPSPLLLAPGPHPHARLLLPPGPHPHAPLLLPPPPCHAQNLWTRPGLDRFKSNAPLSKIPSEDSDLEESRSSLGPGSDPGLVWVCGQSRKPSVDSVYGSESNASSRESLSEAPPNGSQRFQRPLVHLPLMRTQSSPASTGTAPAPTPLRFTTGLVYDSQMQRHDCRCGDSSRHPENPERIRSIWERLNQSGLRELCEMVPSRKATLKELKSVHSRNYVLVFGSDALEQLQLDQRKLAEYLSRMVLELPCGGFGVDIDTIWSERHTATASRVAAGCVTDLALKVAQGELKNGFCCGQTSRTPRHATLSSRLLLL